MKPNFARLREQARREGMIYRNVRKEGVTSGDVWRTIETKTNVAGINAGSAWNDGRMHGKMHKPLRKECYGTECTEINQDSGNTRRILIKGDEKMETVILTPKQGVVMDAIANTPGIQYKDIIKQTHIKHGSVSRTVIALMNKGLVTRKGTSHQFEQYWTGLEYEISEANVPREICVVQTATDRLINKAVAAQLTDEQRRYVKDHKDVPRSKLAARFGMSKLEFNFALAMSR